jgi:hypothetical protein
MESVVIFYYHLEYFMAIWHNVRQVYFFRFGMLGPRKIWQPWQNGDFFIRLWQRISSALTS